MVQNLFEMFYVGAKYFFSRISVQNLSNMYHFGTLRQLYTDGVNFR